MNALQCAREKISCEMERIGISIADVSTFTMHESYCSSHVSYIVIAGYLPNRACLCTAHIHVNADEGYIRYGKYMFCAQLGGRNHEQLVAQLLQSQPEILFSIDGTFEGAFRTHRVSEGITYFDQTLRKVRRQIVPCFTEPIMLNYVPEDSDPALCLQKSVGKSSPAYRGYFNNRVLELLKHKRILSRKQKPECI